MLVSTESCQTEAHEHPNRFDYSGLMTAPRPRRTTLKRVAERAGVSLSTASLVFSGKGPVSEETAARVRTAATALGYRGPDPVASSLRAGRSGVVAVVVESPLTLALRDPYAVQVLDGLADELGRDGLGLLLLAQDPHDLDELGARTATMAMDAAIFPFCGPSTNPLVETLAGRGIPIIGSGPRRTPASPTCGSTRPPPKAWPSAIFSSWGTSGSVISPCRCGLTPRRPGSRPWMSSTRHTPMRGSEPEGSLPSSPARGPGRRCRCDRG